MSMTGRSFCENEVIWRCPCSIEMCVDFVDRVRKNTLWKLGMMLIREEVVTLVEWVVVEVGLHCVNRYYIEVDVNLVEIMMVEWDWWLENHFRKRAHECKWWDVQKSSGWVC